MSTLDNYIYLHRRKDNDEVFYVGKGKGLRMYSAKDRSKEWREISSSIGFYPCVIESNLSEDEADERELHWMKVFSTTIVNKKFHSLKAIPLSAEMFSDFRIDPDSPSGLSKIKKDGSLKPIGYVQYRHYTREPACWVLWLSKRKYGVHRVILTLSGVILCADTVVNHINCNPLDNRLENLEVCSQSENNQRNRITLGLENNPTNTSGVTGVYEVTNNNSGNFYTYAMACWSENNKSKSKKFSYNKYGKEKAWELAIAFRNQKVKELYGENL